MGFFTGRVTFLRFRVDGPAPGQFGPEHLEKLIGRAIGKQRLESKDGTEVGWIAGNDILDMGFDLAKNVVADAFHFALRLDTQKLPADLLRSYVSSELQVLATQNPSGRPTFIQKRQARETARERLEAEAKDGRYLRRKAYPILWDAQSNEVLVGTTSASALVQVQKLFQETFGYSLVQVNAGNKALQRSDRGRQPHDLRELRPATFVNSPQPPEVAWVKDPASHNYLGNEFLLWLWFVLEAEGDTLALADGSEASVMLSRTLALECPRALSGSEIIRSEGPTRLPEARRAIQAGKLPRQAGLTLVRHDHQYELTLQAEMLALSGAKLPAPEEREERLRLEERVNQLRHLIETMDLLYDTFLGRRLGTAWPKELERMQQWLRAEERNRLAAAG